VVSAEGRVVQGGEFGVRRGGRGDGEVEGSGRGGGEKGGLRRKTGGGRCKRRDVSASVVFEAAIAEEAGV